MKHVREVLLNYRKRFAIHGKMVPLSSFECIVVTVVLQTNVHILLKYKAAPLKDSHSLNRNNFLNEFALCKNVT